MEGISERGQEKLIWESVLDVTCRELSLSTSNGWEDFEFVQGNSLLL